MSQIEEEKRLKELAELEELLSTVVLDDYYLTSRDLSGKGRDVHPSGKQRRQVNTISTTLKINTQQNNKKSFISSFSDESQSDFYDDASLTDFDLNLKPRVFISSGPITRYEPGKYIVSNMWSLSFMVFLIVGC